MKDEQIVAEVEGRYDYDEQLEKVAFFHFNPYAGNGTGFMDWSNPYSICVINGEYELDLRYKESDMFNAMERSLQHKEENLRNLSNYTKLKFNGYCNINHEINV